MKKYKIFSSCVQFDFGFGFGLLYPYEIKMAHFYLLFFIIPLISTWILFGAYMRLIL